LRRDSCPRAPREGSAGSTPCRRPPVSVFGATIRTRPPLATRTPAWGRALPKLAERARGELELRALRRGAARPLARLPREPRRRGGGSRPPASPPARRSRSSTSPSSARPAARSSSTWASSTSCVGERPGSMRAGPPPKGRRRADSALNPGKPGAVASATVLPSSFSEADGAPRGADRGDRPTVESTPRRAPGA
jgi:hypothetical protein